MYLHFYCLAWYIFTDIASLIPQAVSEKISKDNLSYVQLFDIQWLEDCYQNTDKGVQYPVCSISMVVSTSDFNLNINIDIFNLRLRFKL